MKKNFYLSQFGISGNHYLACIFQYHDNTIQKLEDWLPGEHIIPTVTPVYRGTQYRYDWVTHKSYTYGDWRIEKIRQNRTFQITVIPKEIQIEFQKPSTSKIVFAIELSPIKGDKPRTAIILSVVNQIVNPYCSNQPALLNENNICTLLGEIRINGDKAKKQKELLLSSLIWQKQYICSLSPEWLYFNLATVIPRDREFRKIASP